ncbi:MAG: hypothetical protein ABI867_36245 [Kofleriaceae bacterium]
MGGPRCERARAGDRRAGSRPGDSPGPARGADLIRFVPLLALVAACGRSPKSPELAADLETATALEVAAWRFDEATWRQTVVEPYRDLYADYVRAFTAAQPAITARLAKRGAITDRQHYADDPKLTLAEQRVRWALPVMFASRVAAIDDVELDVVFVRDTNRWLAIAGLDSVIRDRVAALDPACATPFDLADPPKRCREITWEIADSALRTERARFTHACTLAQSLCGKPSP